MTGARVLLLADGRFPAGGHAHSAGVEAAVRAGHVRDEVSFEPWLRGRLTTTGVTEAAFAAAAAGGLDRDEPTTWWAGLAAELDARTPSPRARQVSRRLGRQLARAADAAWLTPTLGRVREADAIRSPIVLGVLIADPLDAATVSLHHHASAAATATVRLLALDPLRLAAVQARLAPLLDSLASNAPAWASAAPSCLPAVSGALIEILAEDHGHWDARLFVG